MVNLITCSAGYNYFHVTMINIHLIMAIIAQKALRKVLEDYDSIRWIEQLVCEENMCEMNPHVLVTRAH